MFKTIITYLSISLLALSLVILPVTRVLANNGEDEIFLVAQKAFEDGFYDVAMRYIDQLLQDYPQTKRKIEAQLLLGQCYFFKSQYLKAYEIFQGLLKYPEYKDATLFWLGETYLKGSDYKQAEKQYRDLTTLYPGSIYAPQGYYSLGWVYFEQGQFDKAKETFLKLTQKFPTHELSEDAAFKLGETEYNRGQYQLTIDYFKNYILKYANSTRHAECYFYIAESYYYLQDYLNAITYYAKAAEISYDNKVVFLAKVSMGWGYLKLGKYKLAQDTFNQALAFSKEKGLIADNVYLGLASLYSETNEYDKALEAYAELIKQFSNSHRVLEAYLGQANIYYLKKDYAQAISSYQALLQLESEYKNKTDVFEKAYFGLAWAYLKAGNINAAIKSLETIESQTENKTVRISALTQIGDAYQEVEQYDKAIDVYDRIIQRYPDSVYTDYVQYRQGIALLKTEKIETAILSFRSLQTNFPDSKYLNDTRYYLAVAYFKRNQWPQAKEQVLDFLKNVEETNEFLAEANYILGLCYFHLQQYDLAIQTFGQILKNFPEQTNMIKNAHLTIAKSIYKKGEMVEAINAFKNLIAQYPQTDIAEEALIWIGDYYLENSQFDTAITYYQEFVKNFPGSEQVYRIYFQLSQAHQAKGELDQALHFLKQVKDPNNPELNAKAKLSIADIFTRELDPKSAIETYQNIIETSPEFKREAYLKIAEIHKKNKDYTNSLGSYREALKASGKLSQVRDAEIQFSIADNLELLNQLPQALEEYLKIPYLYEKDLAWIIRAYLRAGRIFEDTQQWQEAKTIYQKVIALNTAELKFAQERLDWINANVHESHKETK